jgi:hypothetical protein
MQATAAGRKTVSPVQITPTSTRHVSPVCCHKKNQVTISSQIPYHVKLFAHILSQSAQACPPTGERYHIRKALTFHYRWTEVHVHTDAILQCGERQGDKNKTHRTRRDV